MSMSINSISGIGSSGQVSAISAVKSGANLSEDTIKKLKELGIDPSTVKSESEAQALISQAETTKSAQATQSQQPSTQANNVNMQDLYMQVQELGAKVGITVSSMNDLRGSVDKIDSAVNEVTQSAGSSQQTFGVKQNVQISTGKKVEENSDNLKADLQDVKAKLDEMDKAKASAFAGLDMMATLNKFALGL